jgi:hypothetical protein
VKSCRSKAPVIRPPANHGQRSSTATLVEARLVGCPWPMVTKSSQFPHCNSHQPILDGLGHPTRQHGSEQQKAGGLGEAAIGCDPPQPADQCEVGTPRRCHRRRMNSNFLTVGRQTTPFPSLQRPISLAYHNRNFGWTSNPNLTAPKTDLR